MTRIATFVLTGVALAAAAPALGCPTGVDLGQGILVKYDDDSITRYSLDTAAGGNVPVVVEDTVFTDGSGEGYRVTVLGGLVKTSYVDTEGNTPVAGTLETVAYATDLAAMMPITPGAKLTTRSTLWTDGDDEPLEEAYSMVADQLTQMAIGPCTYGAIPVTHTWIGSEGVFALQQNYLPDLGLAIYMEYRESGYGPETFTALEIAADAP